MTPEQVREAAEQHQSSRLRGYSVEAIVARDAHGDTMARYILATVHADDHLPITGVWLREEYRFRENGGNEMILDYRHDDILMLQDDDNESWDLWLPDVSYWPVPITTRHQFRMLATALGIQPKKEIV
ncbi:MAG TPA: hypothetical protein PLN21_09380 [Gemmatales bacterium]|nr:hypothetical protein [Gemmatales bacterium]